MKRVVILSLLFTLISLSVVWAGDAPPTPESNKVVFSLQLQQLYPAPWRKELTFQDTFYTVSLSAPWCTLLNCGRIHMNSFFTSTYSPNI